MILRFRLFSRCGHFHCLSNSFEFCFAKIFILLCLYSKCRFTYLLKPNMRTNITTSKEDIEVAHTDLGVAKIKLFIHGLCFIFFLTCVTKIFVNTIDHVALE